MPIEPKGNDMADELLPCPHCGKPGLLLTKDRGGFAVVCGGTPRCLAAVGLHGGGESFTKIDAFAAWNARLSRPSTAEAVAWRRATKDAPTQWFDATHDPAVADVWRHYSSNIVEPLYTHPSPQGGAEPAAWRWLYTHPIGETGGTDEMVELDRIIGTMRIAGGGIMDIHRSWLGRAADALTRLRAERDAAATDRDKWLEELGKVILACPMRPDMRMSPASQGVRNLRTAFEALEQRVAALVAMLHASRDQLTAIIDDGLQTDFKSWRDDIDAALATEA